METQKRRLASSRVVLVPPTLVETPCTIFLSFILT